MQMIQLQLHAYLQLVQLLMLEGNTAPCPLSMLQEPGIPTMSGQTDEVKGNFKACDVSARCH